MEYKITKSNLNKAKEKIVLDYLEKMKKEAKETTKEIFDQFAKNKMGEVISEETINAKRNRR